MLIDGEGGIVAGHGRVEAAKLLGYSAVPTVCLEHLSGAQKRAYIIADNKLAENADWDLDVLALELRSLSELDIDFEVEITGFEAAEIDVLIDVLAPDGDHPAADAVPQVDPSMPSVSREGDLWLLGPHRLLCGDARKASSFETLMAGRMAQMVFVDPPYNVPIPGHVSGLGAVQHQDFVMASGEMTEEAFTGFLKTSLSLLAEHSIDGAIHFVCMDWRHLYERGGAGRQVYQELKNLCVWNKSNDGMGSLYRSKHELVAVYKSGTAPHINNVQLAQHGRNRTNVWDHPGVNTLRAGRLEELEMHPTVKPVALVADAILDCSRRGGLGPVDSYLIHSTIAAIVTTAM